MESMVEKMYFVEELVPNTWCDFKMLNDICVTGKEVLDVGCGTGFLSDKLAEKAKHVTGIDISETNIRICNSKKRQDNIDFRIMDANNMKFDNKFDAIFAINILEHLDDLSRFMKDTKKLLNPGGLFITIIGTKQPLLGRLIINASNKSYPANHPQVHRRNTMSISDIPHNGFRIIQQKKYGGIINTCILYLLLINERIMRKITKFEPESLGDYASIKTPIMTFYVNYMLPCLKYIAKKDLLKVFTTKEMIIFENLHWKEMPVKELLEYIGYKNIPIEGRTKPVLPLRLSKEHDREYSFEKADIPEWLRKRCIAQQQSINRTN